MRIINQTRNAVIAEQAEVADTALSRLKGLLGRESLPAGQGLVITDCRSIHMLFMRFAIDVIFVDRKDKAIGLVRNIKPFRFSPYFWRAAYCIELPPGTIDAASTALGDTVLLQK